MTSTLAARPSTTDGPVPASRPDAAYQAFWLLPVGFTVAPILFGLDKLFHARQLGSLARPVIVRQTAWTAHQLTFAVDFGLFIAAVGLARLAAAFGTSACQNWFTSCGQVEFVDDAADHVTTAYML
jgi:hypothetical protein